MGNFLGRNNIISITSMTNEDSSYPKENLTKKDTGIRAKSTTTTTIITASTTDSIRDIFLIKPIADEGNITITQGATEIYNEDIDFAVSKSESAFWNGELVYRNLFWVDLGNTYPNLVITITMTSNSSSIIELGYLMGCTVTKIGEGATEIPTKLSNVNSYHSGQLLRTQRFKVGYGTDKSYKITCKPEDYYYIVNSINDDDFGIVVKNRSDHFNDDTTRLGYLELSGASQTQSQRMNFNLTVRSS